MFRHFLIRSSRVLASHKNAKVWYTENALKESLCSTIRLFERFPTDTENLAFGWWMRLRWRGLWKNGFSWLHPQTGLDQRPPASTDPRPAIPAVTDVSKQVLLPTPVRPFSNPDFQDSLVSTWILPSKLCRWMLYSVIQKVIKITPPL